RHARLQGDDRPNARATGRSAATLTYAAANHARVAFRPRDFLLSRSDLRRAGAKFDGQWYSFIAAAHPRTTRHIDLVSFDLFNRNGLAAFEWRRATAWRRWRR